MSDEQEQTDTKYYSLTFALDRGNFFRRACPSCGRHFKTEAGAADMAHILQPVFRRTESEIRRMETADGHVIEPSVETVLHCPYCGNEDDSAEMLTAEFQEYLERYAFREMIMPQIRQMFSKLSDSFGRHRSRSRGLFSIDVKFEASEDLLPPRPIAGPEPPDMLRVRFLCCDKRAKILDSWHGRIVCPYCGTVDILH